MKQSSGALLSIKAGWQVPVVFSQSKEETRDVLVMIGTQKETVEDVMPLCGGSKSKRLRSRQLYILQGLPNIGPLLAQKIIVAF